MAINNLYSKRQQMLRGEVPEIMTFDNFSIHLRTQVNYILDDAFGTKKSSYSNIDPEVYFTKIHDILRREYGVDNLGYSDGYQATGRQYITRHILFATDVEKVLDAIELCFRTLTLIISNQSQYLDSITVKATPSEAVEELNIRFREHGVGYQFESDRIIRVDSTFIHSEITKPVLKLLWNDTFAGANDEYLRAHEHYRHRRNKECLNECLKALESTLKIIIVTKGWNYNSNHALSDLVATAYDNELIPKYIKTQLGSIRTILTSGVNSIRNKVGAHGQGPDAITADDETTRFTLNLTGSYIIYLIELSKL